MTTTTVRHTVLGRSHPELEHAAAEMFASAFPAYQAGNQTTKRIIESMVAMFKDSTTTDEQRHAAVDTLVEVLFPQSDGLGVDLEEEADLCGPEVEEIQKGMENQEAVFAKNLKSIMEERKIGQKDLAKKIGVGQPAISMMLKRKCRPQRSTVQKLAEALAVEPKKLWPTF